MAKKNKGVAAAATEAAASIPQGSANGSEDGGEKEGSFLLGQPTWEDAGGGRWRCAETGHELPEWEKDAYAQSRACRLALIENAVARKKPPLNAFKPHPEHKSKLVCNITGDTVNKSEEHIWKHINGKRFLNKLEKLEEKMTSRNMDEGEVVKSNEASNKNKPKKDTNKVTVVNPTVPRDPEPEMDDSDDPDFWVPPVGSRWDDDDGKDRWESSAGKKDATETDGASGGGGDDCDDDMPDADDAESRELASSRTKRMSQEAVGPSSFSSRKKKPKKDQ